MSKNAFIVNDKNNYFYKDEPQCFRRPRSYNRSALRLFNRLLSRFPKWQGTVLAKSLLPKGIMESEKIIFTDTGFHLVLYEVLKRYYDSENMYLYYMNLIDSNNCCFMDYFPSRCYSFDPEEARRYNIKYRHLPYSSQMTLQQEPAQCDALFLGREKGRLAAARNAADLFASYGLNAKIKLLGNSDPEYKLSHHIPYAKYLRELASARSILEFTINGQTSCTLRFLESLFLKKKLITDNVHLVEDPWYDPNNVFLLGVDDPNGLSDFIAQPYRENDRNLEALDFKNWIQDW